MCSSRNILTEPNKARPVTWTAIIADLLKVTSHEVPFPRSWCDVIEGSVGVGGGGGVTLCLIGLESMLLARWIASHNPRCHIADKGIYFVSRLINGANDSVPSRRRPGPACTALTEPTNQKSALTPMGRLRDGFFDLKPLNQIDEKKIDRENAPRVGC